MLIQRFAEGHVSDILLVYSTTMIGFVFVITTAACVFGCYNISCRTLPVKALTIKRVAMTATCKATVLDINTV